MHSFTVLVGYLQAWCYLLEGPQEISQSFTLLPSLFPTLTKVFDTSLVETERFLMSCALTSAVCL